MKKSHNSTPNTTDISHCQIGQFLDGRVYSLVDEAHRRFGTQDLVVVLDLGSNTPTLNAVPRHRATRDKSLSDHIRQKLSRPASYFKKSPWAAAQSFWFVVLDKARAEFCAVNAIPAGAFAALT